MYQNKVYMWDHYFNFALKLDRIYTGRNYGKMQTFQFYNFPPKISAAVGLSAAMGLNIASTGHHNGEDEDTG